MDESDALSILADSESKITHQEALEIIDVLKQSTVNYADSLKEKIIGPYSFYEGEYNGLRIAERILNKLSMNDKEK